MNRTKRKEPVTDRKKKDAERKNRDMALLLISIGFLVGGILGCFAESKLSVDASLVRFFQETAKGMIKPSLGRELWIVFRWPVIILALSFLPAAGWLIPAAFCVRGFFLSYGIAALVTNGGISGACCAGLLYGPVSVLTVPVLFILGTEGLLRKAETGLKSRKLLLKAIGCLPILFLCVFLDQNAVPMLLTSFLQTIAA